MPGPVLSLVNTVSESLDTFHSCEDVQEAWECNGDLEHPTPHYIKHSSQISYKLTPYINGKLDTTTPPTEGTTQRMEGAQQNDREVILDRQMTCLREYQEDMDMDDGGEVTASISIPVLEARLSVDLSTALTRQKIGSIQRGRTLSYVDKDDPEEAPTRRTRPLSHNRESMEVGGPLQKPPPPPPPPEGASSPSLPPKTERNAKVSRNPSYHSAVNESPSPSSPSIPMPPKESQTNTSLIPNRPNLSRSSQGHLGQEPLTSSSGNNEVDETPAERPTSSALPKWKKTPPLDLPAAANMPRSASFSEGPISAPTTPANSSLSAAYGRRGSISQPSTPVTKRATQSLVVAKETTTTDNTTDTTTDNTTDTTTANIYLARGSAISRSFRRLFSTPAKLSGMGTPTPVPAAASPSSSASSYPEDYWIDQQDLDSQTGNEPRSTSRLRKLSTTLTRKLSTRSKMSNSLTFPTGGTNGQLQGGLNGETGVDSNSLVDYEELKKLFTCSGCQNIMAPPLHQCRKGHLVCNTCRFSLKQVCPVCKQRFAETTNLMMEQVCHLVKFPCRWSSSGCREFHPPKARLDHEHFCVYRPLHCHHASRGCTKVLLLRDMQQHLEECEYKGK